MSGSNRNLTLLGRSVSVRLKGLTMVAQRAAVFVYTSVPWPRGRANPNEARMTRTTQRACSFTRGAPISVAKRKLECPSASHI